MSEDKRDEAEEDDLAVELGDGKAVEGAPPARVLARLHFGIEASEVQRREGDTVVRTPNGPRELGDVLAEVDETYFPRREALAEAIHETIGTGPVPTDE